MMRPSISELYGRPGSWLADHPNARRALLAASGAVALAVPTVAAAAPVRDPGGVGQYRIVKAPGGVGQYPIHTYPGGVGQYRIVKAPGGVGQYPIHTYPGGVGQYRIVKAPGGVGQYPIHTYRGVAHYKTLRGGSVMHE